MKLQRMVATTGVSEMRPPVKERKRTASRMNSTRNAAMRLAAWLFKTLRSRRLKIMGIPVCSVVVATGSVAESCDNVAGGIDSEATPAWSSTRAHMSPWMSVRNDRAAASGMCVAIPIRLSARPSTKAVQRPSRTMPRRAGAAYSMASGSSAYTDGGTRCRSTVPMLASPGSESANRGSNPVTTSRTMESESMGRSAASLLK
jgi:hypothetical protein